MPEDRRHTKFNRNPMLWLAVAFGSGIVVESVLTVDLVAATAAATVLIVVSLVFRSQTPATWLMLAAAVCAGLVSARAEKQSVSPDRVKILYDSGKIPSGDPVEVEGVLQGRPEASVDGVLLTVATERIRHRNFDHAASGNVRLFLKTSNSPADLKYGFRIRFTTKLERDDGYLNPGGMPLRYILDRQRIDATGAIKSPLLVEKLADESVFLPLAWVYDRRAAIIDSLRKNLSTQAAGVMIASLLGNREFLDKETADLFRDGGTFHILVISGLHITFFGGFLLWILRMITRRHWALFSITNIILWLYTLAVGADVPVVRAALMFTVMSFAYVIRRQGGLLNSLGISVLILLAWRPSDVFNPSFQLTFVSVAAIVAIAFPLLETLKRIGRWTPTPDEPFPPAVPRWLVRIAETLYWNEKAWQIESKRQIWRANLFKTPAFPALASPGIQMWTRPLFEGILVSSIVLICMLPLSILYFHRVAVAGVVLNLWVGFFIALESFVAVTAVMIAQLSAPLAKGFFALANILNWLMLLLPRALPVDGWLSFRLPAYTGSGQIVYLLLLLPITFLALAVNTWRPFEIGRKRFLTDRRWVGAWSIVLAAFVLVMIIHPLAGSPRDGRLRIDFLDVGQGDSALVTFPDGKTMLVDGGGRMRYREDSDEPEFVPDFLGIGETVVSPFLWGRGLSRIDFVLATHGDADHIQGLTDVAKNFKIGTAILGRQAIPTAEFEEFTTVLGRRGVPIEYVAAGDVFIFGEVTAEILNPVTDQTATRSSNDSSVVVRLTFGDRSILLTGDIETAAERELAVTANITADVIKVAHHGSRTSSTQAFVDRSGAKIAVIPVGRTSPHGHPHTEVVERWKAAGAEVITTGSSGTVTVSTDGKDVKLSRFQD